MFEKVRRLFKKKRYEVNTAPMDERWNAVFEEAKKRKYTRPSA